MNNEMIGRARALLAQKMASEASPLARLRGKSSKVSSADAFFSGLVEGAFLLAAADGVTFSSSGSGTTPPAPWAVRYTRMRWPELQVVRPLDSSAS